MVSTRNLLIGLRVGVSVLLVAVVARGIMFTAYRVEGTSMRQTLESGDRILVGDMAWLNRPVVIGDTVVVELHDEVLVKRVVAGPGDVIAMDAGTVVRNGQVVEESIPAELNRSVTFPDYAMGPAELFLLGDNRRVSIDSRDFGPVRIDQVVGRVFLRMSDGGMERLSSVEPLP